MEDDAALFNSSNYRGTSIDSGNRIPKEPWRPGGRQYTPYPPATTGVGEGIEMHERMVREAASVYDTARVGPDATTAPGQTYEYTAYARKYYR
jgi:hypothetical protein